MSIPDLADRNRKRVWTDESRRKLSVANTGKKHKRSTEYKKNLSRALKAYYSTHTHHKKGKPHSKEHREKISAAMRGRNNWNWKGGRSSEYPSNWMSVKRAIRKRDGGLCMLCGIGEFGIFRAADVHHINASKADLDSGNLISLCRKCHLVSEHHLDDSIPRLRSVLSECYGYSYA